MSEPKGKSKIVSQHQETLVAKSIVANENDAVKMLAGIRMFSEFFELTRKSDSFDRRAFAVACRTAWVQKHKEEQYG